MPHMSRKHLRTMLERATISPLPKKTKEKKLKPGAKRGPLVPAMDAKTQVKILEDGRIIPRKRFRAKPTTNSKGLPIDPLDTRLRDEKGNLVPPWEHEDVLDFAMSRIGMLQRRWAIAQAVRTFWMELHTEHKPLDRWAVNKILELAKDRYVSVLSPDPIAVKKQIADALHEIMESNVADAPVQLRAIQQLQDLFGFTSRFGSPNGGSGPSGPDLPSTIRETLKQMDESAVPAPNGGKP